MKFTVRALAPGGSAVVSVDVEAANAAEAHRLAGELGHAVLSVKPVGPMQPVLAYRSGGVIAAFDGTDKRDRDSQRNPGGTLSAGGKRLLISTPSRRFDVAWWCRELRTLLNSGMTVVEAIETLAADRHDAGRDRVHGGLLHSLHQGQSLSRAMTTVGVFPQVLIASVIASERTSTLVAALDDYLRYDELLQRLRRQATSAAIYPLVVVTLGSTISLFLLLFVVPRFSKMYADRQAGLSAATEWILAFSRLLQDHGTLLGLGALASIVALAALLGSGSLFRAALWSAERVGVVRHAMDQFRLAKLYQSLSLMVRGGYTIDEALAVGAGLDLGRRLRVSIDEARASISRGRTASAALSEAGLTEIVTQRLLAVGERTGAFNTVLQTIADRHAERFATFVERSTRLVEPILLLVVALVVGGIVLMMYMPVFDMASAVGSR